MLSNDSFEDLLEKVDMKTHECFMLLDQFLEAGSQDEGKLEELIKCFGNYSLHSGLLAGVV